MEEILTEVIAGLPNLAVSLIALWWITRMFERVLDVLLTLLASLVETQRAVLAADVLETQELEGLSLKKGI